MIFVWQAIFFITALLYSSVGMGGASAYLAYLTLMNIDYKAIPPTALTLSILSSFTSVINWIKSGYFRKKMIPVVIVSAPTAFLGGTLKITQNLFDILVGTILIITSLIMLLPIREDATEKRTEKRNETVAEERPSFTNYTLLLILSGVFGLIGGIVGIGCGVFIGPISYLLKVTDEKETAALSSFFILVNSISGLGGHITKSHLNLKFVFYFSLPVIMGAFAGSNLGAKKLTKSVIQRIFAVVIASIGVFRIISVILQD